MIDNAALAGLGCVGGLVLGMAAVLFLLLYSMEEIRRMVRHRIDRK